MSKKKTSKILAAALCATTMAAFYAAPVMAGSHFIASNNASVGVTDNAEITLNINGQRVGEVNNVDGVVKMDVKGKYVGEGLEIKPVDATGSFKVANIAGNTMIYTMDGTSGVPSFMVNAANGNIESVGSMKIANGLLEVSKEGNAVTAGGVHMQEGALEASTILAGNGNFEVAADGSLRNEVLNGDGSYNRLLHNGNGTLISAGDNTLTVDKERVTIRKGQDAYTMIEGGNITASGTINGATITAESFNGVNIGELANSVEGIDKVSANVAGITRPSENETIIEGKVAINSVGNVYTPGSIIAENGFSTGNGNFAVSGATGDITTKGAINGVSLSENGIKFGKDGKTQILASVAGDAIINGNTIGFDGINASGGLSVGVLDKKFGVDADGNVEAQGTLSVANGAFKVDKDGTVTSKVGNSTLYVGADQAGMKNGNNAVVVDNNGVLLGNAFGSNVRVGENGVTFTNGEAGSTVINGGNISNGKFSVDKDGNIQATTYNGINIEDLKSDVEASNKNVAGITRRESAVEGEYVTEIEGKTMIASDGTFSTAAGKFVVDGASGAATFKGAVNLGANASFTSGKYGSINLGDFYDEYRTNVEKYDEAIKDLQDKTQNINKDKTEEGHTQIDGDLTVGDVNAGSGNINAGNVNAGTVNADNVVVGDTTISKDGITSNKVTVGDTTIDKDGITSNKVTVGDTTVSKDSVNVGGENGTTVSKDGVTVGGENGTSVSKDDVVINKGTDKEVSLSNVGSRVDNLEQGLADANSRIDRVDEKIDKVGAMAAAIANLRTMGYDPEAPTEIAVGVGQYRSETGAALGFFHYPNKDFMLSMSVSTSGDEVMGGIGATWKFGRKTPAEMKAAKERAAEKVKLEKAAAIKKAAELAKVEKQQQRHAELAAKKAAK